MRGQAKSCTNVIEDQGIDDLNKLHNDYVYSGDCGVLTAKNEHHWCTLTAYGARSVLRRKMEPLSAHQINSHIPFFLNSFYKDLEKGDKVCEYSL